MPRTKKPAAASRSCQPRRAGAVLLPLTAEEKAALQAAADREERPLAQWMRVTLLREARRYDNLP